jgi:hypothetical protein
VVDARLHPADVIAHDEQDIRFLVLRLAGSDRANKRSSGHKQRQAVITYISFHFGFLAIWFWVSSHHSSPNLTSYVYLLGPAVVINPRMAIDY